MQKKESDKAKKNIQRQRYDVKGRLQDAVEMLILFTKESQEDTKEMKWKIEESHSEISGFDKKVRT